MPLIDQLLWLSLGAFVLNGLGLGLGLLARFGKLKRNYILGIRVPSTLKNDEAWYTAHRAASAIWVIGPIVSFVVIAIALAIHSEVASPILLATTVGVLLVAGIWGSIVGANAARRLARTNTDKAIHQ